MVVFARVLWRAPAHALFALGFLGHRAVELGGFIITEIASFAVTSGFDARALPKMCAYWIW